MINKSKNLRSYLAALLLMAGCSLAEAHDFTVTIDGQKLYFNITDAKKLTAELTYNGSIAEKRPCLLKGRVEVPAQVKHDEKLYSVNAVGAKAFSQADQLQAVILPAGIATIGDFAFEGCTSLESIVLPPNKVKMGQGIFFRCSQIKSVTLGADWTEVNLAMFQWSNSLTNIYLPAKVEKIHNVKKLARLASIDVDANNTRFTAHRGMLYSRDGKTLYACPRAYKGSVIVKEGTETITAGALIDCHGVTSLDLPASLKQMSFRETSRMKQLEAINMRAAKPIVTAYSEKGKPLFLLQVASQETVLNVAKEAKKNYKNVIEAETGEYAESSESKAVAYTVKQSQLMQPANINGVKIFE